MDGSIDFNALDLGEVLGEGSFGKVKKARFNNKDVAVKELYTQNPEALKREIKNLMRASHKNIIFLYGVAVNDGVHFLVTDYAEGGSLFNFLHVGQKPDYRLDHAINWSYQCVEAVKYLHSLNVIHRDLKPHNILLSSERRIAKICDFGTVRELATTMTNKRGTAAYMAPEVYEGEIYGKKCDVFSWGVTMWEILSRKIPYEGISNAMKICDHVKIGGRPPIENFYVDPPPKLINLVITCWNHDAEKRPSMEFIVEELKRFPTDSNRLSL